MERTFERDRRDYSGTPRDPIVKPATGTSREQAKAGETIMELFEQYAAENPTGIATDNIAQARRDVGSFLDYAGQSLPANRIDKKAVREWKALLMKFPVKATESKEFTGKTIAQIVRHNEKVGKPGDHSLDDEPLTCRLQRLLHLAGASRLPSLVHPHKAVSFLLTTTLSK